MSYLIIAEKPSVAKLIAKAIGASTKQNGYLCNSDYLVTWAYGHLLELYDMADYNPAYAKWNLSNFPFLPEQFKYKPKVDTAASAKYHKVNTPKEQLKVIETLVKNPDTDRVIIATDYDREGQVIADSILAYVGNTKPTYRMLLNEWTPESIKYELQNLIPNSQMINLSRAGFCRQWLDWLIGINWTSTMTLTQSNGITLNIGRVILPTLKILYDREKEINSFKSRDYYSISVKASPLKSTSNTPTADGSNTELDMTFFLNGFSTINSLEEATSYCNKLHKGLKITITGIEEIEEQEYAKELFNLTALQSRITSKYTGWTADKVLKVCQSLYEKQHITYPRTESRYLDESTIGKTKSVFNALSNIISDKGIKDKLAFKGGKYIFNSSKVHAHGALIPTYMLPKDLSNDENLIYTEIAFRFLSKMMPPTTFKKRLITCSVNHLLGGDQEQVCLLTSEEKVVTDLGWRILYEDPSKDNTATLSKLGLKVGDELIINRSTTVKGTTKPPSVHTEASVLSIMEHCGKKVDVSETSVLYGYSVGTSATRAAILKKMKDVGYINQYGKALALTNKGRFVVEHFPERHLFDLEFTGRLEYKLHEIEEGNLEVEDFKKEIDDLVIAGVNKLKQLQGRSVLGICPHCGNFIVSGNKGYGCLGFSNGCKMIINSAELRNLVGFEVKPEALASLLQKGKVRFRLRSGELITLVCQLSEEGQPTFNIEQSVKSF